MPFKPLPPLVKAKPKQQASLWKGPIDDGITYSMLCKFLQCRERFRLKVVEGLEEDIGWKYQMEYGSLFHEAMEADSGGKPWLPALEKYHQKLASKYLGNEADIDKWVQIAKMQFPIYKEFWRNHPTNQNRRPIFEEEPFRIEFDIDSLLSQAFGPNRPNRQFVTLRGKIDACFERGGAVYLQENKTKGEIDQDGISLTIDQNLQTCIYHEALRKILPPEKIKKIAGTDYNIIRRPLSDRNAPRQGKKERLDLFIARVGKLMAANPSHHFFRWTVPMRYPQLARFRQRYLIPGLHQLSQWWDSIKDDPFNPWDRPENLHFQFPFGIYHSMERGYRGDYFDLLTSGSKRGLRKIDNLFPEVH